MANGKIRFGKQSGGELALVIPDGVTNTEVIVPESGVLVTKQYVDDAIGEYGGSGSSIGVSKATAVTTTGRILIENNKALLPKKAIGDLVFNMAMLFDTVDSSVIASEVTVTTDGTYVLFDVADNVNLMYCVVSYLSEKVT